MDDIREVVCAFCGSIMKLSRQTPASPGSHALRFFICGTCGASELRIDRSETTTNSADRDPWQRSAPHDRPVRSG